jgi:mono/diheme cytochrome c family protein
MAALAAGLLAVAGTARPQPRQETASPEPPTASGWREGAEVYAKVCGHCHESGVAPVIRGRSLPPVVVTHFVRNGSRAMPAFRASEIDDEALARVAAYVSGR